MNLKSTIVDIMVAHIRSTIKYKTENIIRTEIGTKIQFPSSDQVGWLLGPITNYFVPTV